MASKFKPRLKRNRRRDRARSRAASLPVLEPPTVPSSVQVLNSIARHFDEVFESKSPRKALVNALASRNPTFPF
jgi:hypothetical protein